MTTTEFHLHVGVHLLHFLYIYCLFIFNGLLQWFRNYKRRRWVEEGEEEEEKTEGDNEEEEKTEEDYEEGDYEEEGSEEEEEGWVEDEEG